MVIPEQNTCKSSVLKMKQFSKKSTKSKIPAKAPSQRIKKPKTNPMESKKKITGAMGKKLEELDPELYTYLKKNDKKLLEFEESDLEIAESDSENENSDVKEPNSEDEDGKSDYNDEKSSEEESADESESESESGKSEENMSKEGGSDDSDSDDDAPEVKGKVTLAMVEKWEKELKLNKRSIKPVNTVVKAFHACLVRISSDPSVKQNSELKVDGGTVFNAIIRLSVTSLYPYLTKMLNLPPTSVNKKTVQNSKKWSYAKNTIRTYIVDLVKLIKSVSNEDILRVLLKHFHQLIPFVACLSTISKPVIKQLIFLWSTNSDDTVRVVAFLCILRLAASDSYIYLETILKNMYMSYVQNSKFISNNTIPTVNFMRKSLAEMFSLNESVSYKHAFLYIRQLAIYLRNAVTTKKKDCIQAVYNWQFIASLQLWVDVLCNAHDKRKLNSLIYPTVQIIIGTIKLIPTAQYMPLRFHCIKMLIKITKEMGIFIPVLPFIVEVFSILSSGGHHKKLSMRPMDFSYILRLSKAQMQENAFRDAVMEHIYECILEYTAAESHRISFPDTVLLLVLQTKQFLKECKNSNYTRKLKPLLEKVEEVSKAVDLERAKSGIALSDEKGVAAWESNMKLKKSSLVTFYEAWQKMNEQKMAKKLAETIHLKEPELPVLTKLPTKKKKKENEEENDSESSSGGDESSDNESDEEVTQKSPKGKPKPKADKKKGKVKKNKRKAESHEKVAKKARSNEQGSDEDEKPDLVEDFNLDTF